MYSVIFIFGDKFTESQKSVYLGLPIIFILILTTLVNLVYGTIFGLVAVYQSLKCRSKNIDKNLEGEKIVKRKLRKKMIVMVRRFLEIWKMKMRKYLMNLRLVLMLIKKNQEKIRK